MATSFPLAKRSFRFAEGNGYAEGGCVRIMQWNILADGEFDAFSNMLFEKYYGGDMAT